jgi:hypothetical protein
VRRIAALSALTLLLASSAIAQRAGFVSQTGIYAITEPVCFSTGCGSNSPTGNQTTTGKTSVSCALDPLKTKAIAIVPGQSLTTNSSNGTYTPTNSTTAIELNLYDGNCYQMKDPVLSASVDNTGSSFQGQLADGLLNDGKYQVVYFLNIGIGGSGSAQWASGGNLNNRLTAACHRLKQAGWLEGVANTKMFVLWEQGQTDGIQSTSSAQYQANVISAQNTFVGAGCNFPWAIAVSTMSSSTTYPTIQAAQAALVDNVTRFAGPNVDTAVTAGNRYDGTHPASPTGTLNHANAYKTVIEALF